MGGRTAAAPPCAPCDRHHDPEMAHLRVLDDLVDRVDRRERHVVLAQALGPVRERMLGKVPAELPAELLVVLDPRQPRVEAPVAHQPLRTDRGRETVPELLERGQVDGDQSLVGGSQDIGLREPRPVRRGGRVPEREERGERLHREVSHRLEHRDLDEPPGARPAALEQRAQHTVGRIDAGDRVGERRPEKSRPLGIDHDAQETTQRLRDGVVTRAVRVRTGAAKTADRAVDETRVERAQPLDACPQPVCGARPEVLYVDVRLAEPAGQRSRGRPAG